MSVAAKLTPTGSVATRLRLAALVWLAVGTGLTAAGLHWLWPVGFPGILAAGATAIGVGWAKGRFLLARRAAANARRIRAAGEGRCIGGAFAVSDWIVVLAMMGLGAALRHSALPRPWLGWIYLAAGTALIRGSFGGLGGLPNHAAGPRPPA